jgi:predicted DNA-binding protein (MmcQ/YjbR family)
MNVEEIRNYCLSKRAVEEVFPFDLKTLVFKVGGKMFALLNVDDFTGVNLKCEPSYALELRESYNGIIPGYHMNKKHWNTVQINEDVESSLFFHLIDHSYDLVFLSLPKKIRDGISTG